MTVAYGLFFLGLILGWSALFLRGSAWSALIGQFFWLVLIILLSALSPMPWIAAAGAATGALAHLLLQLRLEAARA